jgi:hypothetical protein
VVGTVHGDPEQLPGPRVGAVGADHVAGPDGPQLAGGPLPQLDGDAVGVLVEVDQLGAEADLGQPERAQMAQQHRLQVSWGTPASMVGLAAAACSRSGWPSGIRMPSGEAIVSAAQAPTAAMSTCPARTS